jgi:hypothetical protein
MRRPTCADDLDPDQRAWTHVPEPGDQRRAHAPKVEDFPYVTEEFFVSGTAKDAPYTTRIIVRRPKDPAAFSGVVVSEALHAGGRSLIFEWSRVSILTRRHMFVEIVHSPANINLLKTFNAERYASLNIAMGQTNDVIAQAGMLIKSGTGPFAAIACRSHADGHVGVERHRRAYLADHANPAYGQCGPIFDGFLLTSTNGNTPLPIVDVPMIQMPTQTEVVTWAAKGIEYRRPDSDEPGNRFRLYEVAGMPHNNSRENPGSRTIRARCRSPTSLPVRSPHLRCTIWLIGSPQARRHRTRRRSPSIRTPRTTARRWRSTSTAMPRAASATSGWTCRRHQWRVRKGKTDAQDRLCQLAGTKVPLADAMLKKLYPTTSVYTKKAEQRLSELIAQGWFLPEYADTVRRDVQATHLP